MEKKLEALSLQIKHKDAIKERYGIALHRVLESTRQRILLEYDSTGSIPEGLLNAAKLNVKKYTGRIGGDVGYEDFDGDFRTAFDY